MKETDFPGRIPAGRAGESGLPLAVGRRVVAVVNPAVVHVDHDFHGPDHPAHGDGDIIHGGAGIRPEDSAVRPVRTPRDIDAVGKLYTGAGQGEGSGGSADAFPGAYDKAPVSRFCFGCVYGKIASDYREGSLRNIL